MQDKTETIIIIESDNIEKIFNYLHNYNITKKKVIDCELYQTKIVLEFAGSFWQTYENILFFIGNRFTEAKIYTSLQDKNIFLNNESLKDKFTIGRLQNAYFNRKEKLIKKAIDLNIIYNDLYYVSRRGWYIKFKNGEVIFIGSRFDSAVRKLENMVV